MQSNFDSDTETKRKKRRCQNTVRLKHENDELRAVFRKPERANTRLQSLSISNSSLSSPNEKRKEKKHSNDNQIISPSKLLVQTLSPGARRRATLRLMDKKQKLGINLSNQYAPPLITTPSRVLNSKIEEFFNQDDVSRQRFEAQTEIDINYPTFVQYVPDYIIKPNVDSWGTCLCMTCINPELKIDKLHRRQHKSPSLPKVQSLIPTKLGELIKNGTKLSEFKKELNELKNEKCNITCTKW
ncbi:unnamed protein product [Didymodactylos carnosus]|uniref:Uncharacterized protein n=2 Tax=Didymodactylos carnosus TaxID=1234261 RepID=A0A815FVT4_9BILA|nr:unnamed protein product [Didymodactylos carnosus]CAF4181122.1 unnamed protein product [Didymodactylos carnosus]